jgi:hypothetical protein
MTDARIRVTGRAARAFMMAVSALMLVAGGAIWQLAFRAPAIDLLPLPERLIAATAVEGRRLLADSLASADYAALTSTFEAQRRPAFCGVASSVAVLNALRPSVPRLTQASFFDDLPTELQVTFTGMTLQRLGELLRQHGAEVEIVFASDTSLDSFRALARANLSRSGDYLLVNYERAALGQREGGHISPLAAYSDATDRFLILDVAAYRYPPTWVQAADLWGAMNTVDATSGRTRGFVTIRATARPG